MKCTLNYEIPSLIIMSVLAVCMIFCFAFDGISVIFHGDTVDDGANFYTQIGP